VGTHCPFAYHHPLHHHSHYSPLAPTKIDCTLPHPELMEEWCGSRVRGVEAEAIEYVE